MVSLFMAAENLKTAAYRKLLLDRGIDDATLAAEWGYKKDGGYLKMIPYLNEEARKRLVFHGDADTHRDAKWVSDHFEHGLENFGLLRPRARQVLVKTAEHVRNIIIEVSNTPADVAATMRDTYSRPRGPLRVVKYLYGQLHGDPKNFAASDQAYPFFVWKSKLDKVTVDDSGKYGWAPEDTVTARFGEGTTFTQGRFEVWDGSVLSDVSSNATEVMQASKS